jgi:hypothetical protein
MTNRISICRSKRVHEHFLRAHDTVELCQAMLQILAQAGDVDEVDLLALKAMQRSALAIVLKHSAWSDWS